MLDIIKIMLQLLYSRVTVVTWTIQTLWRGWEQKSGYLKLCCWKYLEDD